MQLMLCLRFPASQRRQLTVKYIAFKTTSSASCATLSVIRSVRWIRICSSTGSTVTFTLTVNMRLALKLEVTRLRLSLTSSKPRRAIA